VPAAREAGDQLVAWDGLGANGRRSTAASPCEVVATSSLGRSELDRADRDPQGRVTAGGRVPRLASRDARRRIVSDITTWVTDAIGDYGLYAVFLLMLIDAVFPARARS
jgi:hypothetical protein